MKNNRVIKARLYQHRESRESGCVPGSPRILCNITSASTITVDHPPALVNEAVITVLLALRRDLIAHLLGTPSWDPLFSVIGETKAAHPISNSAGRFRTWEERGY